MQGPTVVVMDNASIHTSEAFQEEIPKWEKQGLSIFYLPEYSPELNLIEILWRFMKYEWIEFWAYTSFAHLVQYVEEITPHSLYKGPQSLISGGFSEIWVDGIGRPCSAVAMLSPKRLNLGRGGQHESATGATGPGDPRET